MHHHAQNVSTPNIQGFLKHRSQWNENTAAIIAEREGVTLTQKHWDVIHFLRTEFYVNSGTVPLVQAVKRGMERQWNRSLTEAELHAMFPDGLNTQGAKIAGCITMTTVGDLLKIKGDSVWSIKAEETVTDALKLMSEKNIGALMVVESDKLIGIISERDVTRALVTHERLSDVKSLVDNLKVRELMSDEVISVTSDDTLEQCMAVMVDQGFRHLPVLDNNKLSGVLSMPDLVRIIVEQQQFIISQLEMQTECA